MKARGTECLLRIFVGESDRWHHQPLFEAIVLRARDAQLAGATVLHGVMGFGSHSKVHSSKLLRLTEDLPVVIEIVDRREKIEAFLAEIDGMLGEGLATLENVEVIRHHPDSTSGP